jgi:HAD superfamily hydrolase (TIGR01509 family)
MQKEKWAIIWDMDGVIIQSADLHFKALQEVFSLRGTDYGWDLFISQFGRNNKSILRDVIPSATTQEVDQMDSELIRIFCSLVPGNVKLLPGVLEWLQRFQSWGFAQGVASSSPIENIRLITAETGIQSFFDILNSGGELPPKPNPDVYLQVAQSVNIPPERCVIIEDAPVGVLGAQRAGMRCVAVQTNHPAQRLQGATVIVPDLSHLSVKDFETIVLAP